MRFRRPLLFFTSRGVCGKLILAMGMSPDVNTLKDASLRCPADSVDSRASLMSEKPQDHTLAPPSKCRLLEIGMYPLEADHCHTHLSGRHGVQYSCEHEKVASGETRTHCFPLPRIFRMLVCIRPQTSELKNGTSRCPHRPAVEITRYVTIDAKTGEIEIPVGPRFVRPFPNDGRTMTARGIARCL